MLEKLVMILYDNGIEFMGRQAHREGQRILRVDEIMSIVGDKVTAANFSGLT